MLWRTLYGVIPALAVMALITIYLYQQERDAPYSVGRSPDSGQAVYDHMMRMDGFVRLKVAELRGMLDMTFYDTANEWVIYYDAKGNGKFLYRQLRFEDGSISDRGYREITEDGRYCTKWGKLRGGRRRCGRVWRKGDLYHGLLRRGRIGSKYTVRRGNVENL